MILEGDILEKVKKVNKESRELFDWWFGFTCNILDQGWISDKQLQKLDTFELDKILGLVMSCRSSKRRSNRGWTSGLDHDDMSDVTGEPSAMDFYS